MNLDELTQRMHRIRDNNDWKQFHSPKNLAMAASIEIGFMNILNDFRLAQHQ